METLKLSCSIKTFDELWGAIHKTRKGSKTVRVNIESLSRLLMDHSELINKVQSFNVNIEEDSGYET